MYQNQRCIIGDPSVANRAVCRIRNGTLYERLTALTDKGQIVRGPEGYRLATSP
jgi:hypothetical protein